MSQVVYLIPKVTRPVWHHSLDEMVMVEGGMADVPLLGWITAGAPVEIHEDSEQVSIPANMVRKNSYALRVRGHSMVDDNIQHGDIVIIEKRESATNGESVVAMINGDRVTLKRFYIERDGIRLQPANPDMAPIYLRNEEVQILGVVTGVIRIPDAKL